MLFDETIAPRRGGHSDVRLHSRLGVAFYRRSEGDCTGAPSTLLLVLRPAHGAGIGQVATAKLTLSGHALEPDANFPVSPSERQRKSTHRPLLVQSPSTPRATPRATWHDQVARRWLGAASNTWERRGDFALPGRRVVSETHCAAVAIVVEQGEPHSLAECCELRATRNEAGLFGRSREKP